MALQALAWFIPVILISSGLSIYFKAKIKGWFGEWRVRRVIKRNGFEAVHDAYLQDAKDRLTQLDHAVLIAGHLVIIETKNYAGAIFGQAGEGRWTQKLGRSTFKFQNPIMQNKLHTRIAQDLFPDASIHSLICFVGDADFPKGKPDGVAYLWELADAIRGFKDQSLETEKVRAGLKAFVAINQAQYVVDRKDIQQEHLEQLREKFGRSYRDLFAVLMIVVGLLVAVILLLSS